MFEKYFKLLALFVITALPIGQVHAQVSESTRSYVDTSSEILAVFDQLVTSYNQCDYEGYASLLHPRVSFWPSATPRPFFGIDQVIATVKGICDTNPVIRATLVERFIDVTGDTAVVFGSMNFRRSRAGQVFEAPTRFSFTFMNEKKETTQSDWKILHMHISVIPLDNRPEIETQENSQNNQ